MNSKSLIAAIAIISASAASATEVLNVGDFDSPQLLYKGSDANNAPIVAESNHSATQIIYTADQLTAMQGKQLQSISFKFSSSQNLANYKTTLKVYLKETTSTSYVPTSLPEIGDAYYWDRIDDGYQYVTQEFSPASIQGNGTLTIDLKAKPFLYIGNSLMITVVSDSEATAPIRFYSTSSTDAAIKALTYADNSMDFFANMESNGNTTIHQAETGARLATVPVVQFAYTDYTPEDAFSGGKGTAAEPYLISNANDILLLDQWTNAEKTRGIFFKLTTDLQLPRNLTIGSLADFTGTFNGDGHCITVDINITNSSWAGLFQSVSHATIRNLKVAGTVVGSTYTGGVAGAADTESLFENVANYADVTGSYYTGGIVGATISQGGTGSQLHKCANFGTVSGYVAGGIVGYSGQRIGNQHSVLANYGKIITDGRNSGGVIGNPLHNDRIHGLVNFGTTSNNSIAGTVGTPRYAMTDLYYDRQMFYTTAEYPAQAKYTRQLIGSGLKSDTGDMSDENWLYTDGLLPRIKMDGIENDPRTLLYATPVILDDADNVTDIKKPFNVGVANGVRWQSMNGCVAFYDDGSVALVKKGSDLITASLNGYERSIEINVTGEAGIEEAQSASEKVFGATGEIRLNISHRTNVVIYSITGIEVANSLLDEGQHSIPMEKGIYIVKTNNRSYKTTVK